MSIEYIREQLNLALTENELLACLEVHFRSVKEDDLVFYEPLHTRSMNIFFFFFFQKLNR